MIKIGQASLNENNKITGGKPGNQTGGELNTRKYYLNKKGWRVFRANDASIRKKIAEACLFAVANRNIGYDQNLRDTLWNQSKQFGYNPSKVLIPCSTDCSALVRVCCAYAGIVLQNFNTASEASVLLGSKKFKEVKDFNPSTGAGLIEGDILVTKIKGHTVMVVESDSKVAKTSTTYEINGKNVKTIKKGNKGDEVKLLQELLKNKGYSVGEIDGDFGNLTQTAVKKYQKDNGLEPDGVVGKQTWSKLLG